jgi:hypothetical protein
MTEQATVHESNVARGGGWRERLLPAALLLVFLGLIFRPLFVKDAAALRGGAADAPVNFASDILSFVILALAIGVTTLGRIGAIAFNTFREAVRNRILYFILFFALILMGGSGIIKDLAMDAANRLVTDLGLACISFFGLLVAVFVGISLVYNEMERKTIYTIVSKPIHRHEFLLGKFFGLLLTIYVIVGIMALFFFIVLNYQHLSTDDNLVVYINAATHDGAIKDLSFAWLKMKFTVGAIGHATVSGLLNFLGVAGEAVKENLQVATAMTCLELMIVTAFAVLFSSFSTPTLSAVFTIMVFLAGRSNEQILRLALRIVDQALKNENVTSFDALSFATRFKFYTARTVAALVPNLDSLNQSSAAVHGELLNAWRYPVLYALCYTGAILMLAILIFRRRNFK